MADASRTMPELGDTIEKVIDNGKRAVEQGYEGAREYADRGIDYVGDLSAGLTDYVQREPWMAVAGAFLIGYVAAQILRRLSD
jgi:ElaB/YqjD/DUF883 family membrane-anchored ribosome-binding protein